MRMTTHQERLRQSTCGQTFRRWWLIGDGAALVAISGLSAVTMSVSHRMIESMWLAAIFGMIAAMVVQMTLATSIGLLLGSIETQVPSTLGGMMAAMGVCIAGPVVHVRLIEASALGVAVGLGLVLWLDRYRRTCERAPVFEPEDA